MDRKKLILLASNIYKIISVQLLTVVLILIFIEIAVRISFDHITPIDITANTLVTDKTQEPVFKTHPFASFTWIPNATFGRQTVNSQGFVSTREIPFEKEKNELRVITLGGSSTVGNSNKDEETYPRILEELLQNHYKNRKVSVINAAAGAFTTRESLGYLQSTLIYYKPDIILIMHAWNDMYYFSKSDYELSQWRKDFNIQSLWNENASAILEDPLPFDVQYLSWSQLYLHLKKWLRQRELAVKTSRDIIEDRFKYAQFNSEGALEIKVQPPNNTGYFIYEMNLAQINQLCKKIGAKCFYIKQPTLLSENAPNDNNMVRQGRYLSTLLHGFDFVTHIELFNRMYQIGENIFDKEQTIDATSMNGIPDYFIDHIHQSSVGTRQLAEIIFSALVTTAGNDEG